MNEITISGGALPASAHVLGFHGVEAISQPYAIEIFFSVRGPDAEVFDPHDSVGAKACLTIDRKSEREVPFVFSGIFGTVELLHETAGFTLGRAVLVPRLQLLTLSKHSRIFTKQSFTDVLKTILEDNGLTSDDYQMRLGKYETEEHLCQYRESDFDFLSRWMEREGIYYFFEHTDAGERVIFCDNIAYERDPVGQPVLYSPDFGGDFSGGASLRTFTSRHATLPAVVKLKDYDYARPNLKVQGSARVSASGVGEVSLYGERFFTPAAGDRLAKLRAEELLARQIVFHATGNRLWLRPGYVFELEDHPRPAWNDAYLTIEAHHYGNQSAGEAFGDLMELPFKELYRVELSAIPAKVQFRAETRAHWPRIYGYENGTIEGPADSEYAQIDEQGRYNVKFKFDETSLKGTGASTYVRMMQPHGGGVEGFHFPLRKHTEIVLSFLGGDPDRPVISGVVPNALTPSPVTSGNHTKNVIQTGARNRLELEDSTGQERITLSTPYSNTYIRMGSPNFDHELIVKTDDNTLLDAGKNFDLTVGQNGGGNWAATIKDDWITHVESGKHELWVDTGTSLTTIEGDKTVHIKTGNLQTDVDTGWSKTTVEGDTSTTVKTGNYTVSVNTGNTLVDTVSGTTDIKSKGKITIDTQDAMEIKVKSDLTETIDGSYVGEIKGAQQLSTHGPFGWIYKSTNVNVTYGVKSDTFLGLSNTNQIGVSIGTFVGAKVILEASGIFSATYAYKLEIAGGVSLQFKFGAALIINSAVELTVKPTSIETGAAKISQLPTKLAMRALRYHLSGIHVLS